MIKNFLKILLVIYLLIGAGLFFFQKKMIFLPEKTPEEYIYNFENPFHEFFVESPDGAYLNAIHFTVENPKGVILYFHGNAGNLVRWGKITSYFTNFGYDIIVMDYRTYGKSIGQLTEENLYNDARLFYDYTSNIFPEDKIILYGRSLGTTFAAKLAAENHPGLLILETPYTSITEVAQSRFPIYPISWLLNFKFETIDFVDHIHCPTYIFHGTEDEVVAYAFGKKLFEKLPVSEKKLITIPEGNHNNLINFEEYTSEIEKILN